MAVLYANFLSGTTTDSPLTVGATTINSAAFANLPEVASPDTMWIVLDPEGNDGAPEIVQVTAHTASATSATVVRAQQGTTARQHTSGTTWRCAVTAEDLSTLQSDVDDVKSDLSTLQSDVDDVESDLSAIQGAWTGYTPTITQGGTTINKTVNYSKYLKVGKTVIWSFKLTTTSAATTAGAIRLSLPHNSVSDNAVVGAGYVVDAGPVTPRSTLWVNLASFTGTIATIEAHVGVASGSVILGSVIYEAAS